MKRRGASLAAGVMLALATTAASAGDPAAGQAKAVTCAACHGQNGISIAPTYPNLACQKEDYLISSLNAELLRNRMISSRQPLTLQLIH